MKVLNTLEDWLSARDQLRGTLGFVPTMGALHPGHLSLVRRAMVENDRVAVSIFVNPTQFGPGEDFKRYPRPLQADLHQLAVRAPADVVFVPRVEDIYPPGFASRVRVEGMGDVLEGASRPGHFEGVATVVARLFTLVRPDRAYFGQKDGQQVAVIRRMAADLFPQVEIVTCPTLREKDGLAMSSRNQYLKPDELHAAPVLFRALELARTAFASGQREAQVLRQRMQHVVEAEPLARLDYVSVADPDTLAELDVVEGRAMASLAVRLGTTRLIDNILLED
ncbi:MAG: pantoate--beta-alanine ligase [Deltaproteobacteria bacterium]|nr:pantoate--beta-alanine ligase [Deltaproteobacteria bacterium]